MLRTMKFAPLSSNYTKSAEVKAQMLIWRCCLAVGMISAVSVFMLFARTAESATYNLPNCSQTTVQTYINNASDGDTIQCPAGTWTWTTTVAGTPSVTIDKAISLIGTDTSIIDGTTNKWSTNECVIKVVGLAGKMTRITGFTFSGSEDEALIYITGPTFWKLMRIDHCSFTNSGTSVLFGGATFGVIDHCTFNQTGVPLTIRAKGNGNNSADVSTSSFVQPNPAGTDNAVYVEDCSFTGNGYAGSSDAEAGGQLVFRYNTFTNTGLTSHDTAYTGNRGLRHWEIYNNTFTATIDMPWPVHMRAGTGVIHDNVITGLYDYPFSITNYRSFDTSNGESLTKWGWCDGTYSCDDNNPSYPPASNPNVASGYPCMDQIGRITDTNDNGPTCYGKSGHTGPAQPLDPLYAWNNKYKSSSYNNSIYVHGGCKRNANGVSICVTDHIKSGRDYYDNVGPKPGYKPLQYPHPLTFTPINPQVEP